MLGDVSGMREAHAVELRAVHALPATPAEWWTVLVEGKYQHPRYGTLDMTRDRLARYLKNFRDNVYGTQIPLSVNHIVTGEGAPGWVRDMRLSEGEDGKQRLQIQPELNSLGDFLITDNRVRYVSASFWDEWTEPTGQTKYHDVISHVAVTEDPWMKNLGAITLTSNGAPPTAADETAIVVMQLADHTAGEDNAMPSTTPQQPTTLTTPTTTSPTPPAAPASAAPAGPAAIPVIDSAARAAEPTGASDMQRLTAEVATLRTQLEQTQTQLTTAQQQAQEATATALAEMRRRETTELTHRLRTLPFGGERNPYRLSEVLANKLSPFVMKFSGAAPTNQDGSAKLGADSKPVPSEREEFLALLQALGSSLVPQGTRGFVAQPEEDRPTQTEALRKLNAAVAQKQQDDPELTWGQAMLRVREEQPDLVAAAEDDGDE